MRARTRISLIVMAACIPVMALSLLWWLRDGNTLADAMFQVSGSLAVLAGFFGILFPVCARWAARVGFASGWAKRNPVIRFMAGLDED